MRQGRPPAGLWIMNASRPRPPAWLAAIDGIGPKLWTLFAGKLDAALKKAGVKKGARLIVLPTGALGLLPLELARDPARRAGGFAEAYNVTAIPSLEAYLAAARAAAKPGKPSLAEAVNPTGDDPEANLPFTEVEGAIVASRFKGKPLVKLDRSNATPAGGAGRAPGQNLLALRFPRQVRLGRRPPVRPPDEGPAAPHRRRAARRARNAREARGSWCCQACEAGLYDTARNPDEFVGLPAAFLELGDDGMMARYGRIAISPGAADGALLELHIDKGWRGPALKQAKVWLRTTTRRELIAYANAVLKPASAKRQPSDFVAQLSAEKRSVPSRFAAIWNRCRSPMRSGAGMGKAGGGG